MCVTFEYHVFRWIEKGVNERTSPLLKRFLNFLEGAFSAFSPFLAAFHATEMCFLLLLLPFDDSRDLGNDGEAEIEGVICERE